MQMRDDLGITTKLENGKAYLEFVLPETIGRLQSALQIVLMTNQSPKVSLQLSLLLILVES